MKSNFIYILNYFQADMSTLNKLRNLVNKNKAKMNLVGNHTLNKNQYYKKLKPFIYGKCIIVTLKTDLEKQKYFFKILESELLNLNIYINGILIHDIYYTISNLNYLFNKLQPIRIIPYSIIYFYQILKTKQIQSVINSYNLLRTDITTKLLQYTI